MIMDELLAPFRSGGRTVRMLVLLYVLINAVVLTNAVLHDGRIQYDAPGHIQNLKDYGNLRYPNPAKTIQFFCPPLPYIVPGLFAGWFKLDVFTATKIGQVVNAGLSLLLTWTLLRMLAWAAPDRPVARVAAIGLLGMMPVYYRTFAYMRGEPSVATFGLLSLYCTLRVFHGRATGWRPAVLLGLAMGLTALSRQWGMLLLLACAAFAAVCCLRNLRGCVPLLKAGAIASVVAFALAGWYYIHLHIDHGSITAFNKPPSAERKPAAFLLGAGNGKLFSRPYRGSFNGQGGAVFYSDAWGDYWGYFLIGGRRRADGALVHGHGLLRAQSAGTFDALRTNRRPMSRYLGFTNRVALLPSIVFAAGLLGALLQAARFASGRPLRNGEALRALFGMAVVVSLAGLVWFAMHYRIREHSTVKATYMLQVFPLLAALGGFVLDALHRRAPRVSRALAVLLVLSACCLAPAWFTRYVPPTMADGIRRLDPLGF